MLLICPKCKTKNYLDPYPFWNFKGTTQCADCRTVWRIETQGGGCVSGPEEAKGPVDLLPGFAEKQDYSPLSRSGADPVRATRPQGRGLQTHPHGP